MGFKGGGTSRSGPASGAPGGLLVPLVISRDLQRTNRIRSRDGTLPQRLGGQGRDHIQAATVCAGRGRLSREGGVSGELPGVDVFADGDA